MKLNDFGKTGAKVSPIGFGTYRTDIASDEHKDALIYALNSGINLIDTSSNYTNGGAERLIGRTLEELNNRESVFLVTKGGYIQGTVLNTVNDLEDRGKPFSDVVVLNEGLKHCIHPSFIEHQIQQSMDRLKVSSLDGYLLHNPEYYLMWAKDHSPHSQGKIRDDYYARIGEAFELLESMVSKGWIKHFGISSNTFIDPGDKPEFTSLSRCLDAAKRVSKNHHFDIVQFPLNLLETGAVTEPNQPDGKTVLDIAKENNLATMANRPLNAIRNNNLLRLVDLGEVQSFDDQLIDDLIEGLVSLEGELETAVFPDSKLSASDKTHLLRLFMVGNSLKSHWRSISGWFHWKEILNFVLLPQMEMGVEMVSTKTTAHEANAWLQLYLQRVNQLTRELNNYFKSKSEMMLAPIKLATDSADDDWKEQPGLRSKALQSLVSTQGVDSVLLGMRTNAYVDDALGIIKSPLQKLDRSLSWKKLRMLQGETN